MSLHPELPFHQPQQLQCLHHGATFVPICAPFFLNNWRFVVDMQFYRCTSHTIPCLHCYETSSKLPGVMAFMYRDMGVHLMSEFSVSYSAVVLPVDVYFTNQCFFHAVTYLHWQSRFHHLLWCQKSHLPIAAVYAQTVQHNYWEILILNRTVSIEGTHFYFLKHSSYFVVPFSLKCIQDDRKLLHKIFKRAVSVYHLL